MNQTNFQIKAEFYFLHTKIIVLFLLFCSLKCLQQNLEHLNLYYRLFLFQGLTSFIKVEKKV